MKTKIRRIVIHILICCSLIFILPFLQFQLSGDPYVSGIATKINAVEDTEEFVHGIIPEFVVETMAFDPPLLFVNGPMKYEYYSNGDGLPYYVISPNNFDKSSSTPLIVWLHGSGECNVTVEQFTSVSLPNFMLRLTDSSPNAYIICPQLSGKYSSGRWNNDTSANQVLNIINAFIFNIALKPPLLVADTALGRGLP